MPAASSRNIFIVSLLCSIGLWVLGFTLIPAGARSGYTALVYSEEFPDREITGLLENSGLTGMVGESGQWFFLDCFGSIEQIPLDEFSSRVLPFDPRNDGYAAKLRSLFVRDGKRIMYLPAGSHAKKIAAVMGDIPYSLEPVGPAYTGSVWYLLPLFCLVSGAFFAFRRLRNALRPGAAVLIPCLPLIAPLSLGGAAGFTLAALLSGLAVLLARPQQPANPKDIPRRLLPFAFLAVYGLVVFFCGLPVMFTVPVLVLCGGVCVFSLKNINPGERPAAGGEAREKKAGRPLRSPVFSRRLHQRFSPVLIMGRKAASLEFAWAMIPYTCAACLLALAGIIMPAVPAAQFSMFPDNTTVVTEADYHSHFLFQATFSQRSLHTPGLLAGTGSGMSVYRLAPDGLPEPAEIFVGEAVLNDIPPFPLGNLLRELEKAGGFPGIAAIAGGFTLNETLLALAPLLFIIPCLIMRAHSGNVIPTTNESIFVSPRGTLLRRPHRSA